MKLTEIPKQVPPAEPDTTVRESVEGAPTAEADVALYGLDPSSPQYAVMKKRLEVVKRTDPALYQRIVGME